MIVGFSHALRRAIADEDVRALIITGAGRAFCVGADVKQLAKWQHDVTLRDRFYTEAPTMFRLLEEFSHPIIAAVNGIAAAGGFELCCCADLVVAADDALIGDGHANYVGFGPVSCVKAPSLLPSKTVNELLLTGDLWPAGKLAELGFVNSVVPADGVLARANEYAAKIASKPPKAIATARWLMRRARSADSPTLLSEAFEKAKANFLTEDFLEGVRAFQEKRLPCYQGR
jgi:enoyl-CoA hydratase/carnithine racemase